MVCAAGWFKGFEIGFAMKVLIYSILFLLSLVSYGQDYWSTLLPPEPPMDSAHLANRIGIKYEKQKAYLFRGNDLRISAFYDNIRFLDSRKFTVE
jgi:hypothetical protein